MKYYLLFIPALCLLTTFTSCKKCKTCERPKFCATCYNNGNITVTTCSDQFELVDDLDAYISERTSVNNDSCSKVPAGIQEKEVCSSGLFGSFTSILNDLESASKGYTCRD